MTTTTYSISGMTCTGCEAKVSYLLGQIPEIKHVSIDLLAGKATVDAEINLPTHTLQTALKDYPKYQLKPATPINKEAEAEAKTWFSTYKPILLVFGYITLVSSLSSFSKSGFDFMLFMQAFMAGFFLVFSFFKLLNLSAFAQSYAMYDIVAKRFKYWGYGYAFLELGLGISYLLHFNPYFTNWATLILMSVSIIGVLESVWRKKKIQCACLGAVFNLPMSTVTIIEDALMIAMSVGMLIIAH